MREKSSSVLTSRWSRSPLRWTTSSRSRRGGGSSPSGAGQGVLDRAEHQRQRGAELVADVGEEGGLGPVEFGQRLGPLPLLLVGPGVGDGGGDLAGQQVEEAPVAVVEHQPGADPGHDEPGESAWPGFAIGRTTACCGGSGQTPPGSGPNRSPKSVTTSARPDSSTARSGHPECCPSATARSTHARRGGRGFRQARGTRQASRPGVGVEQVDQDEGEVVRVLGRASGRRSGRLPRRTSPPRSCEPPVLAASAAAARRWSARCPP